MNTRNIRRAHGKRQQHRHALKGDARMPWLPDMDSNHDKQIQSLLCYRYTIRHVTGGPYKV